MSVLSPAFVNFINQQKKTSLVPEEDRPLIQESLKKVYPKVEKFYPIYSDTSDAWQADLTFFWDKAKYYTSNVPEPPSSNRGRKRKNAFVPRVKIAVLCVININSRFAFAEVTEFSEKEVEDAEETTMKWDKLQKVTSEVVRGVNKTADKTLDAFKIILDDMKGLKGRTLREETEYQGPIKDLKGIGFKVKTLYVDEGSEFKGAFEDFCDRQKIHLVVFAPSEGTKRRMGIVERFHRTLKAMIQQLWKLEDRRGEECSSVKELLPQVMKNYNFSKSHRSLTHFVRKTENTPKGKWNRVAKGMTPFAASFPGLEAPYIAQKEKERKEVEEFYKEDVDKLKRRPRVRFFKANDTSDFKKFEDRFQRQGAGTLTSDTYRIKGRHAYRKGREDKKGDSFALDGLNGFRVLPYDVNYPSAQFKRTFKK